MGCALAYQLAKRNVDVALLEHETLGSQSTGKCAGGVRQQFSMEANVRLQRMSVRMFENFEFETGHPADFRQIGYLFVLTLPQHIEDFRHNVEMWQRVGLTEARWVDPDEAARMVPALNVEDVLGCTFCPSDGIASPADVTAGYVSSARPRRPAQGRGGGYRHRPRRRAGPGRANVGRRHRDAPPVQLRRRVGIIDRADGGPRDSGAALPSPGRGHRHVSDCAAH